MLTIPFGPAEREVLLHRLRTPAAVAAALHDRFDEDAVCDAVRRLETQVRNGFARVGTAVEEAVLRDAIEGSTYLAVSAEAAEAGKITTRKLAAINRSTRSVVEKVTNALRRVGEQRTEKRAGEQIADGPAPPAKPQITFLGDTFGDRLLREWVSSNFTAPLAADVIVDHLPEGWVTAQVKLPDSRHLQTVLAAGDDNTRRKVIVMCDEPSPPGGYHSWAYLYHTAHDESARHRRGTRPWKKAEAKCQQALANMIGWASR